MKPTKVCMEIDCDREVASLNLCSRHYQQLPHQREASKRRAKKYQQSEKGKTASAKKAKRWRDANPEKHLYWLAKSRAIANNLPFNIEYTDIIIPEICPVLGIRLFRSEGKPSANSPTLDKIIPELGYIKGNIKVISRRANELKNNMTVETMENLLNWLKLETDRVMKEINEKI